MHLEQQSSVLANLELFSTFVEHTPAAIAMLDRNLRYLLVSRRWLTDYALENQDILGREHYKIFPLLLHEQGRVGEWESRRTEEREYSNNIPPSYSLSHPRTASRSAITHSSPDGVPLRYHPLERWQQIFALCLAGEPQKGDSDYFIRPDGSQQKVKWKIQPWRTVQGEIGGIMMLTEFQESSFLAQIPESDSENGSCRLRETATEGIWGTLSLTNTIEQLEQEVTERRQAQSLQQESEERYRSLIAAMAEGIILQDVNGIIHTSNAAAERILKVSANQLMGRKFTDLNGYIVRENGELIPREEHPLNVTLRTGQSFTDVVIGLYNHDGTLTWLSLNSQPLFRPNETTPYAAVVSFIDITKRKQIGEALLQSEERFRATFEQAAVGITHAELDGSFVRVNQKFCDIVGYTRE